MAGDGVRNGPRRGRKLKPAAEVTAEEQQMVDTKGSEKKSTKRSSSSRRSKRSSKKEVANMAAEKFEMMDVNDAIVKASYMAEEQEAADADKKAEERAAAISKTTDAEGAAIDAAVESGNYKSEFITGDDAADQKRIQDQNFQKTGVDARGRVHECCDETELIADAMMRDALINKAARQNILSIRMNLLKRLWLFRDEADCEDDYDNDEFHDTMRQLATIQRKLKTLDTKIGAMMNGAEQSSSDSEGDGENDELKKLKNARQNLRYAMNPGTFPC